LAERTGGTGAGLVLSESRRLRIGSMGVFYFAQGLPLGLFLTAIAAWLAASDMPPGAIATIIATTYLPWSFKFFGAALMDRYTYLPMGRRRIWLIGSQAVILAGLTIAAFASPGPTDLGLIAWLGFAIFCGGAMQDVAVDGLAVDILREEEQGTASAFMFGGQALGMAAGAAMGGYLLQHHGATVAFLAFAPLNGAFLLFALVLRERPGEKLLPWTRGAASAEARAAHGIPWLQILGITGRSMIRRDSLVLLAASVLGRAVGGAFAAFWPVFATTRAGFDTSAYSGLVATIGFVASLVCMGLGTLMVGALGPRRATILSYAGYGIMALVYLAAPDLAAVGYVFVILTIYWNMTDTLTSLCSNPLRMRLSDKRVGATQFTIYNSLSNLPVPMGAALFAWLSGVDGMAVLMPVLVGMIMLSCLIFATLRIGNVVDHPDPHEAAPAPRID
jgi:PAT family beta-lactamase induction signal transducer AmpG